jgi:hypothetical protein
MIARTSVEPNPKGNDGCNRVFIDTDALGSAFGAASNLLGAFAYALAPGARGTMAGEVGARVTSKELVGAALPVSMRVLSLKEIACSDRFH